MPNYLSNAEPFEYPGNPIGCLLIHGFTGTPYEMRELGQRLAAHGYTVLCPALAGHATQFEDILPTRWQDWYASVTDAYDRLAQTCDVIFPIGLSLGGLLALHLTAHRMVNGVVALSAPYTIENAMIPMFKRVPLLYDLVPFVRKDPKANDTQDPTVAVAHPEYDRYPTRAASSLIFDFLPHLHDDLRDVRAPVLLMQGREDRTIPADSMLQFHARLGSAEKEMVGLERSGHLVLEDYAKEEAFARVTQFVQVHLETEPVFIKPRNYAKVDAEFLR